MSESEVLALLDACVEPEGASPAKKRRALVARAALELLYASGLRISELLVLPRQALAGDQRMLSVRGKGGRERLVPLSDSARQAASALVQADAGLNSPYLFPGRNPARAMTRQAFDRILHDVGLKAGLEPARLSPTCYATLLRPTCSRMGRTCVRCKCCWGMRILPQPRFIPMCRPSGCGRLWPNITRSQPLKTPLWTIESVKSTPRTHLDARSDLALSAIVLSALLMRQFLDFEKPVAELENKIDELRQMTDPEGVNIEEETARLSDKAEKHLRTIYAKLTPWQKVQVARHAQRPHTQDYIGRLVTDFTPLAGDRLFGDDKAIIGGIGRFDGMPVMVIGTERGSDLETRLQHNFGMARPEGYRKAQRLMKMAGQFKLPILTFIDTAGAWPGIDAEQRGQAEAIARSIATCFDAPVPLIATVIGEGGSGGAVALGAGDRVLMLEHAIYSVISPEACAPSCGVTPSRPARRRKRCV